jgi:hypothetical protein
MDVWKYRGMETTTDGLPRAKALAMTDGTAISNLGVCEY